MVENKKQNFTGHLGHIFLFLSSSYTWLQKLHHLSEHVACAADNCKSVVNHIVSIKLTCIIITEKHVHFPLPKMCTWRTTVYHVTKLNLVNRWYIIQLYSPFIEGLFWYCLIYNSKWVHVFRSNVQK
jgi:hypothetical protein